MGITGESRALDRTRIPILHCSAVGTEFIMNYKSLSWLNGVIAFIGYTPGTHNKKCRRNQSRTRSTCIQGIVRTRIADITHIVKIGIRLVCIGVVRTVVIDIYDAISIAVTAFIQGIVRARIADITGTVIVGIRLVRIGCIRAIVYVTADPVTIGVVIRVQGTIIADIAQIVTIVILLARVGNRTVVALVTSAVIVGIRLARVGIDRTVVQ